MIKNRLNALKTADTLLESIVESLQRVYDSRIYYLAELTRWLLRIQCTPPRSIYAIMTMPFSLLVPWMTTGITRHARKLEFGTGILWNYKHTIYTRSLEYICRMNLWDNMTCDKVKVK